MNTIVLIGNPIAGGYAVEKIDAAVKIIRDRGINVTVRLTSRKGDAESFAREIAREADALVIAAGGDGTYNEVANGLVHSDAAMAILPLGTTSVLAHELRTPHDLRRAVEIALKGRTQTVHLGKIAFTPPLSSPSCKPGENQQERERLASVPSIDRYFILMAGIGFDGETVFRINEKCKRYSGKAAYIISGLKTVIKYNPSLLHFRGHGVPLVTEDSGVENYKSALHSHSLHPALQSFFTSGFTAVVGNASCYGGDFKVTPDARLTEPALYVFITHRKGKLDLLRYAYAIIRRNPLASKGISYYKATLMDIEGKAHIQIDGDYVGTTPARIEVAPHALKLVVGSPE